MTDADATAHRSQLTLLRQRQLGEVVVVAACGLTVAFLGGTIRIVHHGAEVAASALKRILPHDLLFGLVQTVEVIVTIKRGRRTASVLNRVRHQLLLHAATIKVHDPVLSILSDLLTLVLKASARYVAYLHE